MHDDRFFSWQNERKLPVMHQECWSKIPKVPCLNVFRKEMLVCDNRRGESDKREENPPVVVYRGRTSQHVLHLQPTQTLRDLSPA